LANSERYPGFGARLRDRLVAAGYGTNERLEVRRFAHEYDFLTQSIYQWLGDKGPGPANLQKLAAVFGVTRGWLLFGDETAAAVATPPGEQSRGGGRRPVRRSDGPLPGAGAHGRARAKA
jgi:hypothetical protein